MSKFAYNYATNTSIDHTPFKLNCSYYLQIFYKKKTDSCSKSKLADELLAELRELITVYCKNLYHIQEL